MIQPGCATPGSPLAIATSVPLSAAGRHPLFVYGTLMDPVMLAHVLARGFAADDLVPAAIKGFRRVGTRAAGYPMLVPSPNALVEGRLLHRLGRRDIERINHYESGEYRAELRAVASGQGQEHAAWIYVALDHLRPTGEPWELAAWQARHKAAFFASCDRWMADLAATD